MRNVPSRLSILWDAFRTSRWAKWGLGIWVAISTWDTFGAQILPPSVEKRFPDAFAMVEAVSGLLPYGAWLLILAALIAGASVEYAHRKHPPQGHGPAPIEPRLIPMQEVIARVIGRHEELSGAQLSALHRLGFEIQERAALGDIRVFGRLQCPEGQEGNYPRIQIQQQAWIQGLHFDVFGLLRPKGELVPSEGKQHGNWYRDIYLLADEVERTWPADRSVSNHSSQ